MKIVSALLYSSYKYKKSHHMFSLLCLCYLKITKRYAACRKWKALCASSYFSCWLVMGRRAEPPRWHRWGLERAGQQPLRRQQVAATVVVMRRSYGRATCRLCLPSVIKKIQIINRIQSTNYRQVWLWTLLFYYLSNS